MDPLDAAREELRLLRDADDWDEPTGRTDVHVHLESKPDSDRPPKGGWATLRWVLLLLAAAIGTALAAYLNGGHSHP